MVSGNYGEYDTFLEFLFVCVFFFSIEFINLYIIIYSGYIYSGLSF